MFETIDIIREEVFKLFYFLFFVVVVDDIIVYFPNPIDSSQNYLELSKGLGGNNGHTINIKIKNHMQCGRLGFDPCVGMIPCRRERLPTPVFWPGEFHGLYSPWGCKESDTTEWLSLHRSRKGKTVSLTITMNPIRYLWINLKRMVPYKYEEKLWNSIEVHKVKS